MTIKAYSGAEYVSQLSVHRNVKEMAGKVERMSVVKLSNIKKPYADVVKWHTLAFAGRTTRFSTRFLSQP
jgi:hypothetical protein